jgi:hypothetical protein
MKTIKETRSYLFGHLWINCEKKFVAFGYEAENQYADLVMDNEHDDYYFFHRFKMNLHNNKVFQLFFRTNFFNE